MNNAVAGIISVIAALIGLATLSVILSPRAQTSNVIGATSNALNSAIAAADAPITGATLSLVPGVGYGHGMQ